MKIKFRWALAAGAALLFWTAVGLWQFAEVAVDPSDSSDAVHTRSIAVESTEAAFARNAESASSEQVKTPDAASQSDRFTAIVIPEAQYFVNDPEGIISPVAQLVANAEELDRRDLAADEQGRPGRLRLMRTDEFKHPYLRVEERFAPYAGLPDGPLNPFPQIIVSVANHVLVQFDVNLTREQIALKVERMGATIDEFTLSPGLVVVELPEISLDALPAAMARYPELAEVRFAEANYVVGHLGGVIPNDPDWAQLWGMRAISAPEAWQITTGTRNVVVGVIDSGVDYTHPDLKDNIFFNNAEVVNGQDSDGNGFRDDIRGWDFYDNNNNPMDEHRHGTHVAGTVAAVGNNGIGVTGVAWQTRIMPLRFLGPSGGGTTAGGINSVRYATMMGIDMTNNSWGGGSFSQALYDAIAEARDAGILFVAAAGNDGSSNPGYPARYGNPGLPGGVEPLDNIIIVAASSNNEGDTLASFSQRNAHLAAPGVGIYSTVLGDGYGTLSGTSMASPHVAGAAALLLAVDPDMTYDEIKDVLLMYVDDRSGDPLYAEGIHSKGRMNVFNSMANLSTPVVVHADTAFVDSVGTGSDPVRAGNGVVNPGETVALTLSLRSVGVMDAYNVTATLSTESPYVTIDPANATQSYGNFTRFQTTDNAVPFLLTVAASTPTPYEMPLTLTLSFQDDAGGAYERSRDVKLMVYTSVDVSGVVRHLDGSPFAGASVVYAGPFAGSTTTAGNGAYTFEMVDGTYTVFADAEGYTRSASREYTAPPGTAELNFVLGNSVIESSVPAIAAAVVPGGQVTVTLDLRNVGNLPLDWNLRETEYDFEHVVDAMDAHGNPLIAGRPELAWKEIRAEYGGAGGRRHDWWELYRPVPAMTSTGQIGFSGQTASSGAMMFDFDFPFYGQTFRSARAQSDGWLSFNQTNRSIFHHHQRRLPQLEYTPYMIAFQWAMRSIGGSGLTGPEHRKPHGDSGPPPPPLHDTRHAYSKNWDPHSWVFTWNQWGSVFVRTPTEFDTGQMELRSDGTIIMRYLKYELQPGVTEPTFEGGPVFFQVGMQDGSRTRATSPMFMGYSAYEENLAPWPGSVLIIRPAVAAGWILPSQTRGRISSLAGETTLTLTLDATQLPEGVFESSIVVDSNDSAGNEALRIPITLTVTDAAEGVVITTPSQDGDVAPGQDLTLTASVSGTADPAEVTFLNADEELGTAAITGGAATFVWENVPAGFHELRARVTSAASGNTLSSPVRLIEAGQGLRVRLEFEDQPMQTLGVIDPVSTLFQPPVISSNRAFAERFDIRPIRFTNEADFTWLGSENTRDEWGRGAHVGVTSDGSQVRFVDTNYRKYPFSYTITPNTVLEFDVLIHYYADSEYGQHRVGIGLLNANTFNTARIFSLDYPHRNWAILDFADYTARTANSTDPVFVRYRIPVGQYYTGQVSWIGFVGHKFDTASGGDSDVVFRNVRVYENSTSGDFTFNWSFNDSDRVAGGPVVNRTYFSPGTKEIQVEVTDGVFTNTASRRMEIPGQDTFRVAIDFGRNSWRVPGNLKDTGAAFGDRGNDLWYGWDRNRSADIRSDNVWGFTGMLQTRDRIRAGNGATWRMKVPNGIYTVTAYVGANFESSNNLLRFNGETLIDRNLSNSQYIENSLTLPVTGGEIVISSHRNSASLTHLHIVRVRSLHPMPVASFTVHPQTATAGQSIQFDATDAFSSSGAIAHYLWNFGDGFTGEGVQPTHSYALPGTYEVTLSVIDSDGLMGQTSASVVVGGVNQPALIQTLPALAPALPPVFGEPQPQPGYELTEGGGSLLYGLRLATAPTAPVTVTLSTGARVIASPNSLTLTSENWQTTQWISLTALDDEIVNGSSLESVSTTAASADAAYNGLAGVPFTVTVHDNDAYGTLQFTQTALTVDEGIGTVDLTVTRTGGQSGELTANWTTVNGSAIGGQDFVAASGTLVWAHNETAPKTISVTIIDDEEPEPTENFQVQLTTASNPNGDSVLGSPSAVVVTILDNDNVNPAIILNTPADGATFESGDVVTLSAEVLSSTANITSVRILVDGTAVHTLTAPTSGDTYSFDWTVQTGTGNWQVEAHDDNGGQTLSEARTFSVTPIPFGSEGGFLREVFYGISGNNISDLTSEPKFPASPDSFTFVESGTLRYQENVNNYGTRHRAYFVPPKTGDYVFQLTVRNSGQLWLSSDANPHNRQLIVSANNGTATRSLVAGQAYYLEVLHKAGETIHDRFVQVGVRLPGNQNVGAIPVGLLLPFEGMHIETTTDLIRVPEAGHIFFGVRLSHPPFDEVRVDVTAEGFINGGDSITVGRGTPITFNNTNWDDWRYVELLAAADQDAIDGERTIRIALNNGLFREITAQEIDAQLNHAPEVFITLPTIPTVNLVDNADGLWLESDPWDPDGDELSLIWTKQSGPGTVTFDDNNAADTGVRFSTDGEYVLRVTVSDGEFTAYDEVRVRVNHSPVQLGSVGAAGGGSFTVDGENWSVSGHGTGIGPGSESFRFVYTEIEGDFDIQARLVTRPPQNRNDARAALHIRGDLGAGSPFMNAGSWQNGTGEWDLRHVLNTRVSQGESLIPFRSLANMAPTMMPGAPANPGEGWIRFRRVGNVFTPFTMLNGNWVTDPLHAATLEVGPTVLVGMMVCSGDTSSVVNSSWEHVTIPVNTTTAPQVNAGSDLTVNQNTPVQLNGWAEDDGAPAGVLDVMWRRIAGPTTPGVNDPNDIYTLNPVVTFSVPGTYVLRLLATDGEAATFDDVTITVNATDHGPPIILSQPQAQAVPLGAHVEFAVEAFGLPEITGYQWYKVGTPDVAIPGANAATLVMGSVTAGDAGEYYVIITNDEGTTRSDNASLSILTPPAAPTGLTATVLGHNAIALSWTDASLPGNRPDGFVVEVAESVSGPWDFLAQRSSTTFTHTGIPQGSTRFYRVRAFNVAGASAWSRVAGATTEVKSEETFLINLGQAPYTSDGTNTWQSFPLSNSTGEGNNATPRTYSNEPLVNTSGDASSNYRFSVATTVTGNNTSFRVAAVTAAMFANKPADGFHWFDAASQQQRSVVAFSGNGTYWDLTVSGFDASDTVTFRFVLGRDGTGRNVTFRYDPTGSNTVLLNNVDTAATPQWVTHAVTGSTSHTFRLVNPGSSWVGLINAMSLTVEGVEPPQPPDRYAQWAIANGIVGDLTDLTNGVANLIRYALGGDATTPNADLLPQFHATSSHDDLTLSLTFHRIDDPLVTYAVWFSEDLTDWGSEPIWQATGAHNGIPGLFEVTIPAASNSGFLRLVVNLSQ